MPQFKPTPFGDYVLQDRIGAGGMAEIFLATARGIEGFEKRLVIKRILPTLSDDEQFVRMFIEEAKLCVALRHPNIVQVYDLGAIDQQYYIAMEYVDGRDLLKTLAACGKKRVGFPTDIALYIVMEVLKGLDYAHDLKRPDGSPLGIIHRDVSPSNLLLSYEGDVKIGDFGIAKASTREKTATGILKGKFGYMAPEQVLGSAIDHRADVFAIGIVLYELLTGHRLFAGRNDLAVLERVRDAVVDPPPRHYRADLDDELEHLVLKALGRRADDRFQTAGELHDALHDYVFRSRATVGPAQLGRFMQSLFLHEPEEVARRERVNLPPVVPLSINPTSPPEIPTGLDDDFDDKTPLLDLTADAASSVLSEVVYISEEYQWDKPPASDREHTRGQRGQRSSDVDPGFDCVSTVQTDLPEADVSAEVQLIASGPATGELRHAVDALREAAKQDHPTDWDLSDTHEPSPKKAISRSDSAPTQLDGDDATTGRNKAISRSDSAPTNVENEAEVDPSLIVERTPSIADPTDPSEIEATVRFDSALYPALKDPTETASGGYWMPSISDGIDDAYDSQLDEVSQFGTIRVEAPDLTGAPPDVMDSDVTDAPRVEGTQISAAPSQMEEVDDEDALEEAHADDVLQMVSSEPKVEEEEEEAGRTDLFEPSESALLADIRARQGSRVRRVRVTSTARAASGGGSSVPRRRSSPRRRIVTRAPLSVVARKESSQDDLHTEDPAETTRRSDPAELIARAHAPELKDETGEGPLVPFDRGHEEPTDHGEEVDADPTIPEPVVRRESSGITAALNEAALADAEIQEYRAASVVGSNVLEVGNHHDEDDSEDLDELTDGFGEDLRSAILKRQARRRLVTRSVVLYGDGSGPKEVTESSAERQAGDFAEGSESSVAGIYDAGQLTDEGASELFGVLSVLDEAPPDFSADDELSVETHPRMYADFGDSMSRVETYDPRDDSVASEEDEYSNTAYGSLAPDETAEAEPGSFAAPSFGSDDQSAITSDSHAGNAFAPPREVSSSGIMLDMDSLLSERAISEPRGRNFGVPEDETQEGGEPLVRDRSFSPQSTSEERPAHHRNQRRPDEETGPDSGLVSSRFELPSSMELPDLNAEPDPEPVRPVTWNRPVGIEPTQSQLDDELLAPKRRNNADVLRAVVERQRVAREKNLNPKKHRASAGPVASPLQPVAARPTPGPGPIPGAAAPSMIPPVVVTRRRDTNYRVWTIMYLVVGLAVVLAVAAAVSSFQGRQETPQNLPSQGLQTSKTPEAPAQQVLPPKKEAPAKLAPARSPAPIEEKKAVEKRPPPVQVVDDIEEPPPPKKVRRKARRKTRRKAATTSGPKKKASSAAASGTGKIQLNCSKALDIRISTIGRFENKKRFSKRLKAGFYRISLFDPGTQRMRAQLDINLQAGDPVTIPCP